MARLKKYLPTVGIIAMFFGFLVLYLAVFGKNLFYTQTYFHIATILPPTIDVWVIIVGIALLLNLWFLVLMPRTKFGAIEILSGHSRLRRIIGVIGLFLVIGSAVFLILGKAFQVPWMLTALSRFEWLGLIAGVGGFGLILLFYAISPNARLGRRLVGLKGRLIALCMAMILTVFVISSVELMLTKTSVKQVPISSNVPPNARPSHSVSVILSEHPRKIRPAESIPIELLFRMTNYDPNETAKRYPISLDSNHKYAVSASLRAVGFDVAEPPKELQTPRPIEINQPVSWNWIISPKSGKEGTEQSAIFDVFIHDLTENKVVFQSPITTLSLEVSTPLGLPAWLISPQVGIGAMLGGLVSIILPWGLGELSEIRKRQKE